MCVAKRTYIQSLGLIEKTESKWDQAVADSYLSSALKEADVSPPNSPCLEDDIKSDISPEPLPSDSPKSEVEEQPPSPEPVISTEKSVPLIASSNDINFEEVYKMADEIVNLTTEKSKASPKTPVLQTRSSADLDKPEVVEETKPLKKPLSIPITFGHENWDLSFHMLLGIRIAVAESTASRRKFPRKLEAKDFIAQVENEL
jgi:hypothetical protein